MNDISLSYKVRSVLIYDWTHNAWVYFQEEFSKPYEKTQEAERKSILQNKIEYVFNHNMKARSGEHEYTLGINQFSDLVLIKYNCLY